MQEIKNQSNKQDFDSYIIEKYKGLKDVIGNPLNNNNSSQNQFSHRMLTDRNQADSSQQRSLSCLASNPPPFNYSQSQSRKFSNWSILENESASKVLSKSPNQIKLENRNIGVCSGFKYNNRLKERTDQILDQPIVNDNKNLILPNLNASSSLNLKESRNRLPSSKGLFNIEQNKFSDYRTNNGKIQKQNQMKECIEDIQRGQKNQKVRKYEIEEKYQCIVKQDIQQNDPTELGNTYPKQNYVSSFNQDAQLLLPSLNIQFKSNSDIFRNTQTTSNQIFEDTFRKHEFLNINENNQQQNDQTKEQEISSYQSGNNFEQDIFCSSLEEVRMKRNTSDIGFQSVFQEKYSQNHSMTQDNIVQNNFGGTIQNEEQESYRSTLVNSIIPYQRQWAISSPYSRQSPFQALQFPDIHKTTKKQKQELFNFSKIDKRKDFLRPKFGEQTYSRNPFFDIHFSSFEHNLLQMKTKEHGSNHEENQSITPNEDGLKQQQNEQWQVPQKLKRKQSIFRQKNAGNNNKTANEQRLSIGTCDTNRSNNNRNSVKEAIKKQKCEENEKQRFIKAYTELPRNKKEKQNQEKSKNIDPQNERNMDISDKNSENIFEKESLEYEDSHNLNQQLIQGLEHNIDRFMQSFRQRVQLNQKLVEEIKQECLIFDFEYFIDNIKAFVISSIQQRQITHNHSLQNYHSKNSILVEQVSSNLQSNKNTPSSYKYDIKELISQLLNTKFGTKTQASEINDFSSPSSSRKLQQQISRVSLIRDVFDSDKTSLQNFERYEKHDHPHNILSKKNSLSLASSPRFANNKMQGKQNSQFSREKSQGPETISEDLIQQQSSQKINTKEKINQTNSNLNEESSQQIISQIQQQANSSIQTLKSLRDQDDKEHSFSALNKIREIEEKDDYKREKNFATKRLQEARSKEEDIFQHHMQQCICEVENFSKNNMKITPNVFDQLLTIIMDILIEFQYSNLSINQYISALQKRSDGLVEKTVKTELPKHLYDKLISITVSKMELQQKMSASLTKFLCQLFEVEVDLILKRNLVDVSSHNIRSQQMLIAISEAAHQCQLNYLQFYSLKLFLYETMKDIQVNYKTILKALSSVEAFRNEICGNLNTFKVQPSSIQVSRVDLQMNDISKDQLEEEQQKEENLKQQDEYEINFQNKSSLRKLIEELGWILQTEMVEFMQSDSKLHHELQLFVSDLVFCLVRLYPQQQLILHKKLKPLQKSFFDQIVFYFCQLLFKKKIPLETIRNVFVTSCELSAVLEFEQKLIINIGGFNPILALSYIFSSAHYMDRYKTKCSISNNVSLINTKLLDNNQSIQKQEDDNTSLIVLTIKNYQLIYIEFLLACYFSSSNCYNTYDLKAALTINKLDALTLQKWITYLQKLGRYFDPKSLSKFSQELQLQMSNIK